MISLATICILVISLLRTSLAFSREPQIHSAYVVKDSHHVPRKWTRIGPAPAQHLIRLQIGLKQNRFSELERHLYEGNWILWARDALFIIRMNMILWPCCLSQSWPRDSLWSQTPAIWSASVAVWGERSHQAFRWLHRASPGLAFGQRGWCKAAGVQFSQRLD